MGKVSSFQDLIVWKKSLELSVHIYKITADLKDFGFKDQIRRASSSVGANISEGFHRKSRKEFQYFLSIARGSVNEVHNFLILGEKLGYFKGISSLKDSCDHVSRMTLKLSKSVSSQNWNS